MAQILFEDTNHIPGMMLAVKLAIADGLRELERDTLEQIDQGFEQGTDAMGRPWAPLSPRTIEQKGHGDILIETGEMREAFYGDLDVDDDVLEIGNTNWKLPIHEFGNWDDNVPARPVLRPAADWVETQGYEVMLGPLRMAPERARFL